MPELSLQKLEVAIPMGQVSFKVQDNKNVILKSYFLYIMTIFKREINLSLS